MRVRSCCTSAGKQAEANSGAGSEETPAQPLNSHRASRPRMVVADERDFDRPVRVTDRQSPAAAFARAPRTSVLQPERAPRGSAPRAVSMVPLLLGSSDVLSL